MITVTIEPIIDPSKRSESLECYNVKSIKAMQKVIKFLGIRVYKKTIVPIEWEERQGELKFLGSI